MWKVGAALSVSSISAPRSNPLISIALGDSTINYTIQDAIAELRQISHGKTTLIPLPDDELISSYERDVGFHFSDDFKLFLKEVSNVIFGTKDPLVMTLASFRGQ